MSGAKRLLNNARAALQFVVDDRRGATPDQIDRAKRALECLGPARKDELTLKEVYDGYPTNKW